MLNPSLSTIEALRLARDLNNDLLKANKDWAEIVNGINRIQPKKSRLDVLKPEGAFKAYAANTNSLLARVTALLDQPTDTEWVEVLTVENGEPVRHTVLTKRQS